MLSLGNALLVLLGVGVTAPAAPSPGVAWPGVSDVLGSLNVAAPVPAGPRAVPLSDWLGLADPSVAVSTERAMWCSDFALLRLTAEFSNFDGTEIATAQTVPGIQIYHKMVEVPDGCDTLYVTISATADESFDAMWLTCKVDFVFCNPGPTFETRTPGWLAIQNIPGNFEDNSIYYTWCTAITPGTHAVELRMASASFGDGVFLAAAHFYIDASNTGGGCVQAAPPEDPPVPPKLNATVPPPTPALPPLPRLP